MRITNKNPSFNNKKGQMNYRQTSILTLKAANPQNITKFHSETQTCNDENKEHVKTSLKDSLKIFSTYSAIVIIFILPFLILIPLFLSELNFFNYCFLLLSYVLTTLFCSLGGPFYCYKYILKLKNAKKEKEEEEEEEEDGKKKLQEKKEYSLSTKTWIINAIIIIATIQFLSWFFFSRLWLFLLISTNLIYYEILLIRHSLDVNKSRIEIYQVKDKILKPLHIKGFSGFKNSPELLLPLLTV